MPASSATCTSRTVGYLDAWHDERHHCDEVMNDAPLAPARNERWRTVGCLSAAGVLLAVAAVTALLFLGDAMSAEPEVFTDRARLEKVFATLPAEVRSVHWVAVPMRGAIGGIFPVPSQDDPIVVYAFLKVDERDWPAVRTMLGAAQRRVVRVRGEVVDALELHFETPDGRPGTSAVDVYTIATRGGPPGSAIKVRGGVLAWKVSG